MAYIVQMTKIVRFSSHNHANTIYTSIFIVRNCTKSHVTNIIKSIHVNCRRTFRGRCLPSGHWTQPACIPITCPAPGDTFTGLYQCTNGFQAGSSCTLNCPGHSQVTFLSTNINWRFFLRFYLKININNALFFNINGQFHDAFFKSNLKFNRRMIFVYVSIKMFLCFHLLKYVSFIYIY